MRRLLFLLLVALPTVSLTACGGGFFTVPPAEYQQQVRTLGVLPLLVDEAADITHPRRQEVLNLLRFYGAGKEEALIDKVRGAKGYFDVRPVVGAPRDLFERLVVSRNLQGEGNARYRQYGFNPAVATELAERNVVDGLLVVVLNGVVRPEKRWDRVPLQLNYLEADYNAVLAYAAVVLPTGEVAWEYPGEAGQAFLPLQYPDFDEAYYNKADTVRIKNVTVAGLDRVLAEKKKGLFGAKESSRLFDDLFDKLVAALKPSMKPRLGRDRGEDQKL